MGSSCCDFQEHMEMATSLEYYLEVLSSKDMNSSIIATVVAILVIVFTSVLWKLFIGNRSRRTGILLVGCSDAGKTCLFSQLIAGKQKQETQTSFQENKASYDVISSNKKEVFTLYDLPGHESIRYKYLDDFKSNARGMVFVIDSSTFQSNQKDVAEFLFRIFTDKSIVKLSPAICVACNKQDLLVAKSKRVIRTKLEEELNTLRKTQSAALESTDGSDNSTVYLGVKEKDFMFEHLSKLKIEFVECNIASSEEVPEVNVKDLKSWISSLV